MVGVEGFEPPTLWSQTRCATRLRYTPTGTHEKMVLKINDLAEYSALGNRSLITRFRVEAGLYSEMI